MNTCFYCKKNLKGVASNEHIINQAIGGFAKSDIFCCESCNNILGSLVDDSFVNYFKPFTSSLNMRFDRDIQRSYKVICVSESDSKIYEAILKDGEIVDCSEKKKSDKRNYTKFELQKDLNINGVKMRDNEKTTCFNDGIIKIALGFALSQEVKYEYLEDIIETKIDEGTLVECNFKAKIIPYFPYTYIDQCIEIDNLFRPFHQLILFNNSENLYCFVNLFNAYQFYVVLTNNYQGDNIYKTLHRNIIKGKLLYKTNVDFNDIDIIFQETKLDKSKYKGDDWIENFINDANNIKFPLKYSSTVDKFLATELKTKREKVVSNDKSFLDASNSLFSDVNYISVRKNTYKTICPVVFEEATYELDYVKCCERLYLKENQLAYNLIKFDNLMNYAKSTMDFFNKKKIRYVYYE